MSRTLTETGIFLLGAVLGGGFNALLMSKKFPAWGHYINYGVIAMFFAFVLPLLIQKFNDTELSEKKLLSVYGLLGWIVASSWIAKYVK